MLEYGWFDEKAKSWYADDSDLVGKSADEEEPWTLGGSPQSFHCPPDNLRRRQDTRRPVQTLWKLGSSIRWISIASFFMTFVLWDQIFKLHSIFSLLSSYFDQFCIFRPSDAFFILCNILKRRSYAKVPLVGASSCDAYWTIDKLWE